MAVWAKSLANRGAGATGRKNKAQAQEKDHMFLKEKRIARSLGSEDKLGLKVPRVLRGLNLRNGHGKSVESARSKKSRHVFWRLSKQSLPMEDVRAHRKMSMTSSCRMCFYLDLWRHSLLECTLSRCSWALVDDSLGQSMIATSKLVQNNCCSLFRVPYLMRSSSRWL